MAYIITDGTNYISVVSNKPSITTNREQAKVWKREIKAINYIKVLPKIIKNHNWKVKPKVTEEEQKELSFSVEELLDNLETATDKLEKRLCYLQEMLSQCDLERTDIEHAAEFYKLNASQGYKIYKMLHDNGIKRREIKNEIQKIKYTLGTKLERESITNSKKSVNGLQHQQYSARILKELFE